MDFTNGLNVNNNDYNAYVFRTNSHYWLKNYSNALSDLDNALMINHNGINALILKSCIYAETQEYNKVLETFREILIIDPNNRTATDGMRLLQ
jgi:tetratricopeptide (TPR) repeat protein